MSGAAWCGCGHEEEEREDKLADGFCEVCGLPELTYFVGQVLGTLDDLDDDQRAEVLLVAGAEED
jgi:hypothetical protein